MADFFVREGIAAVAVHPGADSTPRATSLEQLRGGRLEVIFAVDMFNEGVDVPAIDTVLMLRPTESTIIWLQQLGRGLRVAADKDHLTVVDYIGNHRAFLMKLRGIAVIANQDTETSGRQREFLESITSGRITFPAGVKLHTSLLQSIFSRASCVRRRHSRPLRTSIETSRKGMGSAQPPPKLFTQASIRAPTVTDLGLVDRMDGLSNSSPILMPSECSREILDWRLAQYLSRAGGTEDIICRVSRNTSGNPILFLPSIGSGGSLPEGSMDIEVDGRPLEAIVAKIAINVLCDPSGGGNQLPTILRSWFGEDAGLPGRADRVRIRRNANVAVMEPIGASAHPTSGLQLWQRYLREVIPPAFGMPFNRGIWNVGFVTSPAHILLLVTLKKDDANPEHKYADHFLSDRQFNWQSQNRTTQNSKPGQMIRDHKARGLHVHLLVRPSKKISQGGAPFIYCGEVDYVSWEGNAPITVLWRLREPVPPTLWSTLNVPA